MSPYGNNARKNRMIRPLSSSLRLFKKGPNKGSKTNKDRSKSPHANTSFSRELLLTSPSNIANKNK